MKNHQIMCHYGLISACRNRPGQDSYVQIMRPVISVQIFQYHSRDAYASDVR